jgi:hypothetical protein
MSYYAISIAVALFSVVTQPVGVASFLPPLLAPLTGRVMPTTVRPVTSIRSDNRNKEEEVIGDQYEGSVDWDDEWKKVVQDRDQPAERPGKYKSQAEIATIKATNKVAKNVYDASQEAKAKLPSAPSIRSLQGDWRFWIGMLLIVSFGLAALSATSQVPTNDSFYV